MAGADNDRFRLKGKVTPYNARGYFKQAVFPSIDEFYLRLGKPGRRAICGVYWQDNTLRIVSESPGEVTLHLRDLDTYQFPAGGCVITDFADGKIIVQ